MKHAKYQWSMPEFKDLTSHLAPFEKAGVDYSPAFLRLCMARGLKNPQAIQEATDAKPQLFHDPYLFYDMDRAVERIHQAIGQGDQILIYGDYDADGITATLILKEAIESLGGLVDYYLPDRFQDGYGPNVDRYREWIDRGIQLIVTVDNGVAGHEAVQYATERGVDVIITDHHEIQETLPEAYAIIHPRHPKGHYPFGELAGAGVALKVATALLDELPAEAIELAAIGTIADMVSVLDENRTLIQTGIRMLSQTGRVGLSLLFEQEKITQDQITTDTIGFTIAPRLNALGRLGDASPGLEWLASDDPIKAKDFLDQMNTANSQRQDMVKSVTQQVVDQIKQQDAIPNVIIAAHPDWHPGILGIVASRMVDNYQRPCILFHYDRKKGQYKGSGRSIAAVNLFEWLTSIQELMSHFGGHRQAAGMTVLEDQWPDFQAQVQALADQEEDLIQQAPPLKVDLVLDLAEVTQSLYQEIQSLGPFGTDNPKPVLAFDNVFVQQKNLMGVDKNHVKLSLQEKDSSLLPAVAFNMAQRMKTLQAETRVSIAGYLTLNHWQGKKSLQVMVKDFGYTHGQWVDERGSQIPNYLYHQPQALYVFEQVKHLENFKSHLDPSSTARLYQDLDILDPAIKDLVIMEPPTDRKDLKRLYKQHYWQTVYLGSYLSESKYLAGLPTRQDFKDFYQFLLGQTTFKLKQLPAISQYLRINESRIKLMIVVFFEAEFVKIKNGVVTKQAREKDEKVDLFQMPAMTKYRLAMEAEAFLNYQTIDEIVTWMNEENEYEV